jgi:hypothetical protein
VVDGGDVAGVGIDYGFTILKVGATLIVSWKGFWYGVGHVRAWIWKVQRMNPICVWNKIESKLPFHFASEPNYRALFLHRKH